MLFQPCRSQCAILTGSARLFTQAVALAQHAFGFGGAGQCRVVPGRSGRARGSGAFLVRVRGGQCVSVAREAPLFLLEQRLVFRGLPPQAVKPAFRAAHRLAQLGQFNARAYFGKQ